jgi:hypothetical protein
MVRAMPPSSPIQFSALKALNSLHEEPQEAENRNRKQDIKEIVHKPLP